MPLRTTRLLNDTSRRERETNNIQLVYFANVHECHTLIFSVIKFPWDNNNELTTFVLPLVRALNARETLDYRPSPIRTAATTILFRFDQFSRQFDRYCVKQSGGRKRKMFNIHEKDRRCIVRDRGINQRLYFATNNSCIPLCRRSFSFFLGSAHNFTGENLHFLRATLFQPLSRLIKIK